MSNKPRRPDDTNDPAARDDERLTARPVQFTPLMAGNLAVPASNLSILMDIHLQVAVELGRARLTVKEVLALGPGSVVELDKLAGEPVDLRVNDQLVARGEVVVIDDKFGIRVTEILSTPGTNGDQNTN